MIPVDLNRLREARDLHRDRGYVILEVSPPLLALVESAEAVLDAPTVHMCIPHAIKVHRDDDRCDLLSETCDVAWVSLVPVKGQDAPYATCAGCGERVRTDTTTGRHRCALDGGQE